MAFLHCDLQCHTLTVQLHFIHHIVLFRGHCGVSSRRTSDHVHTREGLTPPQEHVLAIHLLTLMYIPLFKPIVYIVPCSK